MRLSKVCEFCDKEFFPRRDKINRARCCSRKCLYDLLGKLNKNKWEQKHNEWNNECRDDYIEIMKKAFEIFFTKTEYCWKWNGHTRGRKNMNYGSFTFRGKDIMAHRASYFIYKGEIPNNMLVLHKCDNPPCVNPDHLWLGTYLENQRDKMSKNRHRGEKLNIDKVKEIKNLLRMGVLGTRICKDFNISTTTLHSIKKGKTWGDIN